ncbi:MAG: RNA 2',3'-cyclic phosphodiesterase [Acidobacteria bacterium]|nr:RNA 2',3'-cyclic phosphodiesterase [Acidobacteriota bacterium]
MKRIFVAVEISNEARRRVTALMDSLKHEFPRARVGWEKPEKLHLTLKFLGETTDSQLEELKVIVGKIAVSVPPFKLRIKNTGVFPNPRSPRVLWIDVADEHSRLKQINRELEADCAPLGFPPEKRDFVPHLTIARIREPLAARPLAQKHLQKGFESVGFDVAEIVIYESKLLPSGSVYKAVERYELEGLKGE